MNSTQNKPYDLFPPMEKLRDHAQSMSAEERSSLMAAVALTASDPEAVSLVLDLSGDDWAHIYPDKEKAAPITTGKAIDTFLDAFGKTSPEEEALLEKLIFNPIPDYSGVLEREEKKEGEESEEVETSGPAGDKDLAGMAELAMKINAQPKPKEKKQPKAPQPPTPVQDASLSLELAKIFVKQGQFRQAYEIISKISLKNPEKSVYFADQLRFLEKLIKISDAKREKK